MFNIAQLQKQAARMQQQMEQVQAQLAVRTVEATSGGGAVKVTARCDGSIAAVKIDPAGAQSRRRGVAGGHDSDRGESGAEPGQGNIQHGNGQSHGGHETAGVWVRLKMQNAKCKMSDDHVGGSAFSFFIFNFALPCFPLPSPPSSPLSASCLASGRAPLNASRLHLVQTEAGVVKQLAEAILLARERIQFCTTCGALTEKSPCAICDDPRRDGSLICVVERAVDILSVEKSGTFRGKFHVLGGKISPLDGVEPEDLRIAELEKRLDPGADQGNRHRPGHGCGRRRDQLLPRETARARRVENLPDRPRLAGRQRAGVCG